MISGGQGFYISRNSLHRFPATPLRRYRQAGTGVAHAGRMIVIASFHVAIAIMRSATPLRYRPRRARSVRLLHRSQQFITNAIVYHRSLPFARHRYHLHSSTAQSFILSGPLAISSLLSLQLRRPTIAASISSSDQAPPAR